MYSCVMNMLSGDDDDGDDDGDVGDDDGDMGDDDGDDGDVGVKLDCPPVPPPPGITG